MDRVRDWGYAGIFAMMFVESSFFPFPSEVAMIPAGYLASQGEMDPYLATLMGLLGSLGGAFFNYFLALWLGLPVLERIGRYFFLSLCPTLLRHFGQNFTTSIFDWLWVLRVVR